MEEKLSLFVDRICQYDQNAEAEKELYLFGISQCIMLGCNILILLTIGVLLHSVPESIVWGICYAILRRYSGGYHANTSKKCLVISILLIAANLLLIRILEINRWTITAFCLSGMILFLLSPQEAVNKPLELIEKLVFRKRARKWILILDGIVVFLYLVEAVVWVKCVMMALISVAVLFLAGKWLHIREKCNE